MAGPCYDSVQRQAVVAAARSWIGTPYIHQASHKHAGTDCLGLLRGVWRETLGTERELPCAYTPDWSEAPDSEPLLEGLARHLIRIPSEEASYGDVLVFRMLEHGAAKHLAILCSHSTAAPDATMIHAYSGVSVVEARLTASWLRRIVAVFRLPSSVPSGAQD